MGGRGRFAAGKQVAYTYETVGKVDGVKIINPIDKSKSYNGLINLDTFSDRL